MQARPLPTVVLSMSFLLCACAKPPNAPMQQASSSASSMIVETVLDSQNERTPTTVDSLEIMTSTGAAPQTSMTASGTILTGDIENTRRLIIFSDYDCAYCRRFTVSDLPWIMQEMVAKGSLSIERIFVPMSAGGEHAARLALCAAEQKKFSEADHWLSTKPIGAIDQKKFASAIGLNLKKLMSCISQKNLLEGNLEKARSYDVKRVPLFVLGTDSWLGLLPREELEKRMKKTQKK